MTPTYSIRDEYKIASTPRKERKLEEVVTNFECLGRIELVSTSAPTSEENIPMIKEKAMSTPNFSGQAELGSASTLMTKNGITTKKEEDDTTPKFLVQAA